MSFTPVIPPYPSPSGGASPEPPRSMPAFSQTQPSPAPAWAQQSSFAGSSPYSGSMPMSAPGSYLVPPVALPQSSHTPVAPVGPSGFSPDWVGFPYNPAANLSPYQGMMQPGIMHPGMMHPGMMQPPPPQQQQQQQQQPPPPLQQQQQQGYPPPQYAAAVGGPIHPQTAYMYAQQLPPQFQAGYPTPAPPMYAMPGMATPYATPYAMPGAWGTPYPAAAGGLPPQGAIPPQGMHMPAAATSAPTAHTRGRIFRPQDMSVYDKVDKFAEGDHYGAVLDPFVLKRVHARVEVNPLLQPPPENLDRAYLKWNMLFPTGQCQRSTDPPSRSWHVGRHAPATWPRLTSLRLISRSLPWPIEVTASNPFLGVTCGEVIETIQQYMYEKVSEAYYRTVSGTRKRMLGEAFYYNRSTADGVPGGRLPHMLLHCDWLGKNTTFGGIVHDEQLVHELCGAALPAVFELRCVESWPVSEEEQREMEARELEADERLRRRGRSRATSRAATSRTTSQAPSRATSRATSRSRATTVEDVTDEDE